MAGVPGSVSAFSKKGRPKTPAASRFVHSRPSITLPRSPPRFAPSSVLTRLSSPSPASVMPVRISTMAPSKLSRSRKLVTPLIASAPYTADAPPVMTSTREIAEEGTEFMSITSVELIGCARRPSTSTSVRFAASPRRLSVAVPGVLVAVGKMLFVRYCVFAGTNCGSWLSTASTPRVLVSSNAAGSTVKIGLAASRSRRTMREPVTTTSSSGTSFAYAVLAVGGELCSPRDRRAVRVSRGERALRTTATLPSVSSNSSDVPCNRLSRRDAWRQMAGDARARQTRRHRFRKR